MGRDFPALAERAKEQASYQGVLRNFAARRVLGRQERSRTLLTRTAGFPVIKTLEQYDFKFATGAPRALVTELSTLTYVERAENVVLLGPSPASVKRIWPLRSAIKPSKTELKLVPSQRQI